MGCGGSKTEHDPQLDLNQDNLPKKYQISESSLEDFLSCERDAKLYMDRHVVETLKVRLEQKAQLEDNIKLMEEEELKLREEIQRNKKHAHPAAQKGHGTNGKNSSDDRLVQNFLLAHEKYDDVAAYQQAEYLASLNRWEMLKKEIYGTKQHVVELTHECEMLNEDVEDLFEICEMRAKILDTMFDGEYGSNKENQLEDELDYLHYKQQRYEECNFKWRQAQVMVEYACKQIGTAVLKWEEIIKLPMSGMEARYRLAEETRNNLIAAGQNLQGGQRYLPKIQFPYCTPEEVVMLNKATSYVFTDMQAKARQIHALECYTAAHRRCGALLQWFNETINGPIMQNLTKVKERAKVVSKELRKERAHLISKLIQEKFGKKIEVNSADLDFDTENSGLVFELLQEEEKNRKSSGQSVTMRGSYSNLDYSAVSNAPSPLPADELAPLPTKSQLFGSLDDIKEEFNMKKKNEANGSVKTGQRRNRTRHLMVNKPAAGQQQHKDERQLNGSNHKTSNHHRPRHPNEVVDLEDVEEIDGAHIVNKVKKKVDRY